MEFMVYMIFVQHKFRQKFKYDHFIEQEMNILGKKIIIDELLLSLAKSRRYVFWKFPNKV